jgi:tRNA(fMet)-specific endonuclease VapC
MPDKRIVEMLDRHGHECAIAAPVWHELVFGCRRFPAGKKRTAIETYLTDVVHASFPILPYDEAAADWHSRERARLEGHGRSVPFVDGQIAAISNVHGLVLVTGNTRDFRLFKGLELANWGKRLQQ